MDELNFKAYLNESSEVSESTIKAYLSDVKDFQNYLNAIGKDQLSLCTPSNVEDYLAFLKKEGKSASTMNRKIVSLRKYYDFLRSRHVISSNPVNRVKAPKNELQKFAYLTLEEMNKLLSMPKDDALGMRDKALLELMYACGLKVTEVVNLNVQDVDLRIGFISCRGDVTKTRIIPMGRPCREAMMTYLRDIRPKCLPQGSTEDALFVNYQGQRISRQGVWKTLKHYGELAKLEKEIYPQLIRNTFTAHMIMNGADLKSLQELLGTDDISVTKLYLSLSKSRVMDVYDKTHPRA